MKRYTSFKFIRLTDEQKAKYELAAAKTQSSFGEWARTAMQRHWQISTRSSGKRKP